MTGFATPSAFGARSAASGLRAQLEAAAAIVGVPITVTDGTDWEVTGRGVRVGLGAYTARGHSDTEAAALALLELWQHLRFPRVSPERARRRASFLEHRPELAPLLEAVLRLQAAGELLTVLPAAQEALTAAVTRSLPVDLREWPRHLQWVGALLRIGLVRRADGDPGTTLEGRVDPAVVAEWWALLGAGGPGSDPLRRATSPDPTRSPLLRWERAIALLLPPFDRLRALDLADRGLADRGEQPGEAEASDGPDAEELPGAGGGADPDDAQDGSQRDGEAATNAPRAPEPEGDRARAGDGADHAEGADLFAAEQAGFVRTFLSTPMPADGALLLDAVELPADLRAEPDARTLERAAGAGAGVIASGSSDLDYRRRVEDLAPAIDRMREVWASVIAERVALRRLPGRRTRTEGDTLRPESLAGAVAEAVAGVPRPSAFVQREPRARRARRAGSTDYVLLVDRSASMQGAVAASASDAALIMLEALAGAERDIAHEEARHDIDLDLDIRTSLIVFDAQANAVKPLSRGLDDRVRREMVTAIRSAQGSTNDGAALREAARQLGLVDAESAAGRRARAEDGLERRRIVIFIGDGGSNDPVAAARELRRLHESGVEVLGIGIGSDEVVARFAPTSQRVDDPRALPDVLHELIAHDLANPTRPRIALQHDPHERA